MPVVTDPGVLNPYEFIGTVINKRLPNPFMPDAPQRIATDTSQKLSIRFGETIKKYIDRGLDKSNLVLIPLVLAGYARYLKALDDNLKPFEPSSDPLLAELQAIVLLWRWARQIRITHASRTSIVARMCSVSISMRLASASRLRAW